MAATRNTDRVRFRYGICLNDNCEKCKSKEVQEIPARKDFVCQNPECGKPLRECPPPKKSNNMKLLCIISAAVVVLGGIGAAIAFSGSGEETPKQEPVTVAPTDSDSIKAAKIAAENQRLKDSLAAIEAANAKKQAVPTEKPASAPAPKPAKPAASSSKDFGYATFKGTLKNGVPDDVNGRLIFNSSHVIDSRDPKARMAEAGDYVIGEFSEGHLVQGIWYDTDGQVKGSIIIGK